MIVGLGIDITSIERLRHALARHGDRLESRVLTEGERQDVANSPDRVQSFAGRFAAKEATIKALQAPAGLRWQDMEIRRASSGAPQLQLHARAAEVAQALGATRWLVSLTHDAGVAAAVVILEAEP